MWQHVVSIIGNKSDVDHSHDDKYYTEAEMDIALEEVKDYADTAANNVKDDLLNGAGEAYDTLKELGDLITDNVDAIDALREVASGKADAEHDHSISDVANLQESLDAKASQSSLESHVNDATKHVSSDDRAAWNAAETNAKNYTDEKINNSVADWNQNDESELDYVKNRTHYSVDEGDIVLFDGTITTSNGWNATQNDPIGFAVSPDEVYEVIYDGVEYIIIGKQGFFGSYTLWNNLTYDATEEPFCYGNGWFAASVDGNHSVKIVKVQETLHRLPAKLGGIKSGEGLMSEVFNGGESSFVTGDYAHAEGLGVAVSGYASHAEGSYTTASGDWGAHAEGYNTIASEYGAHSEGGYTTASGGYSHAEGGSTAASGDCSHAEGFTTTAFSAYSHAEGYGTTASGEYGAHAEGDSTTASGQSSHAEGFATKAIGTCSHAEGLASTASEKYAHAEGEDTVASGEASHAEGRESSASGNYSHSEGISTEASGYASHAEGDETVASGRASHAEGTLTTASSDDQHVQGKCNIEDASGVYAHIVGNGDYDNDTYSNAHTLDWFGNAWFAGDVYVGSTSGKNKDEGSKKLATEEYVSTQLSSIPAPDLTAYYTKSDIDSKLGTGNVLATAVVS